MIDEIRAHVADKLSELDGVLAMRRTPEGAAPYLFHEGDDLSQLVLEPRYPLATIIALIGKRYPEAPLGLVARGCDLRALVEMVKRNQVDPDRIFLVGVACTAEEAEECNCPDPTPRVDTWPQGVLIGTPVTAGPSNPIVAEYERMPLDERRDFWRRQFLKCMKCYGCRNACPECFCESCALEDPLWVERGVLGPPFPTFHLIRAMHMSSRCVACRQCEQACPSHIPLTVLYDLIRRDVADLLDYVPGNNIAMSPPLALTLEDAPLRTNQV